MGAPATAPRRRQQRASPHHRRLRTGPGARAAAAAPDAAVHGDVRGGARRRADGRDHVGPVAAGAGDAVPAAGVRGADDPGPLRGVGRGRGSIGNAGAGGGRGGAGVPVGAALRLASGGRERRGAADLGQLAEAARGG